MGNSSSTAITKNVNNQYVVNKSTVDLLNQTNNSSISNTIIKNASTSSATLVQSQKLSYTNLHAKGDISIAGGTQGQKADLTFDAMDTTQTATDIVSTLATQTINALKTNVDTDTLSKLLASASASNTASGLSLAGSSANTNASNTTNTTVTNTTDTTLKNIVNNSITNNFSSETVKNFIASVKSDQTIDVANLVSDDGKISIGAFSQDQAATLVAKIVNDSGVTNKISNDLATALGVTIVDDKKTTASTTQSADTTSTNVSKGFDITSLFTAYFDYILGSIGSSVLCLICCCLLCVALVFVLKSG